MPAKEKCLKNSDCDEGFCKSGTCAKPRSKGDPCDGECAGNYDCDTVVKRCMPEFEYSADKCNSHYTCKPDEYCTQRKCKDRKDTAGLCSSTVACLDGNECFDSHCRLRCREADDCEDKLKCVSISGSSYKVCLTESQAKKARSSKKSDDKPKAESKTTTPMTTTTTTPKTAVTPKSGVDWKTIGITAGAIFGAIAIIALIIFIIMKVKKRNGN